MKKRIAILSPFFYPEPISTGKFNTDLVLALKNRGHQVTVFCFHPLYPDWKITPTDKQMEGVEIVRGGAEIQFGNNSTLRRLLLEWKYASFVRKQLKKRNTSFDLVVPIFPPSLAFYRIQKHVKTLKKVGIVHDLQEVYARQKTGLLHRVIAFFVHRVEKTCYTSCDTVVFLSREMKQAAAAMYGLSEAQMAVQYPFVNVQSTESKALADVLPETQRHVVYSGAMGEKQRPQKLCDFFLYCMDKIPNCVFHVFSQGPVFEQMKSAYQDKGILFHNLVSNDQVSELYKRSTVQIVPQAPGTSKGSLPSKLPNLLYTGCKTLVITDANSELSQLFAEHKLREIVTSWDFDPLYQTLETLIELELDASVQQQIATKLFKIDALVEKIVS